MSYTQPKPLSDLLLHELLPAWSREGGTFAAGETHEMGAVLARVGGKYQALDPAGEGDAAVACAIGLEAVDATAADVPGVVLARGGVVESTALVWPAGITDVQKAAGLAQLEARGIVARTAL